MYKNIEIVFCDINNIIEEENNNEEIKDEKDDNEKLMAFKIINHFLDNHILIDLEKEKYEQYYEYSFIYQIHKHVANRCKFYLFTKVTQKSFIIDSNALYLFIDLENDETEELLQKAIEFVKKICPPDITIYILGMYEEKYQTVLSKESVTQLFFDAQINYKYDEINISINKKVNHDNLGNINKEGDENNNKLNENKNNEVNENEEELFEKIDDIIESAKLEIFENERSKKKKDDKNYDKDPNQNSSCIIN